MSKRTLFLIFALFIITFVLLMMALYKPLNPETTSTVIVPKEPVEQTVLLFGQPSIATPSSTTSLSYSLPINITTGKNKITMVQLELQYNPGLLTNVTITPGSFFKNPEIPLNQIDAKTGRISYAFGTGPTGQGIMGNGEVAILTFETSLNTTPTAVLFLPKTLVTAEGVNSSVLKTTKNAFFNVGIIPPIANPNNSSPSAQ